MGTWAGRNDERIDEPDVAAAARAVGDGAPCFGGDSSSEQLRPILGRGLLALLHKVVGEQILAFDQGLLGVMLGY